MSNEITVEDRTENTAAADTAGAGNTVVLGAPRAALIVVDAQNDFVDPAGTLSVPGALERLETLNTLISAADAAGWLVVFTMDWHPQRTPHFDTDGGPWPPHCVAGTWGSALHSLVEVPAEAAVIHKGTGDEDSYSGFSMTAADGTTSGTGLAELLGDAGIEAVHVCGFATDYCTSATAIDAVTAGFASYFVVDAAAAVNVNVGDGDAAIAAMLDAGVFVVTAAQSLCAMVGAGAELAGAGA